MNRPVFQSRFPIECAVLWCGLAVLIFAAFAGTVTAADETVPDSELPTVSAGVSAEGEPMLVTVLALAGALISMERACSWRLSVIRRQTAADNQRLAAVLPPIPSADLPQPSWPFPVPSPGHDEAARS